jgi:cytochrome c553
MRQSFIGWKVSMSTIIIRAVLSVAIMALLVGCGESSTAEPEATADPLALGERKARVCTSCHGPRGVSKVASYPSLAGQKREYLLAQLRAFKSGERENPMMNAMVASLSDTDMQHLATYFAAQGE